MEDSLTSAVFGNHGKSKGGQIKVPRLRLPFTDTFSDLKKPKEIEQKVAKGEALTKEDFQRLMKENGAGGAHTDDPTTTPNTEALIEMFVKQCEIMEKYTKHLEVLEMETKQPEPVEAVTAMFEQTHIQTEAMLATVKNEEEDFSEELQHQLEAVLNRIEEALERLKRKAVAERSSAKQATASALEKKN